MKAIKIFQTMGFMSVTYKFTSKTLKFATSDIRNKFYKIIASKVSISIVDDINVIVVHIKKKLPCNLQRGQETCMLKTRRNFPWALSPENVSSCY